MSIAKMSRLNINIDNNSKKHGSLNGNPKGNVVTNYGKVTTMVLKEALKFVQKNTRMLL